MRVERIYAKRTRVIQHIQPLHAARARLYKLLGKVPSMTPKVKRNGKSTLYVAESGWCDRKCMRRM